MGLILSEPIKKVVEILKILTKMSVEDAKIHPKRPYSLAAIWVNFPLRAPSAPPSGDPTPLQIIKFINFY